MEHVLENQFLNKESAYKQALNEDDAMLKTLDTEEYKEMSTEQVQIMIYDTFVKEKSSLLGYVQALVMYSAKKQGFDVSQLYSQEDGLKKDISEPKDEAELQKLTNRIIIIVSCNYP